MKWTAYGTDYQKGPLNIQSNTSGHQFHNTGGKYVITGIVKNNRDGTVVEGAAVQIGKETVFSNASGVVFTRTKKAVAATIRVSPDDFVTPGKWRVVGSPETIQPALDGQASTFTILVEMF